MKFVMFDLVRTWAKDKGIIDHGDLKTQSLKAVEEVGELAAAILRENTDEIHDSIGDILVVLTSVAELSGTNIEECLVKAYTEIQGRTGKMVDGNFVKQEDL